ncbi:MAG TPA: response regulator [Candidatus Saccharimonadales bacterium]|nr:response regulator [Candidatus Saccharimonadales bacterium]
MQSAVPQKILVVEDEAPMRNMIIGVLQQAGYTVLSAMNGKEGLALAKSEHPDLIVTDNFMPIMNGADMVSQVRSDPTWGAKVPVILMTNVNSMDAINQTLQVGGVDYLMKMDIQLEDVVTLVKQRLEG